MRSGCPDRSYPDSHNAHRRYRLVVLISRSFRDPVGHILAPHDFSKNRVVPLEPCGWRRCNKKLRSRRIRRRLFSHGEQARLVEMMIRTDFVVDGITRTASPVARRVAALDHKTLDDTMKRQASVKGRVFRFTVARICPLLAARHQPPKVCHGSWRIFFKQDAQDRSHRRIDLGIQTGRERSRRRLSRSWRPRGGLRRRRLARHKPRHEDNRGEASEETPHLAAIILRPTLWAGKILNLSNLWWLMLIMRLYSRLYSPTIQICYAAPRHISADLRAFVRKRLFAKPATAGRRRGSIPR